MVRPVQRLVALALAVAAMAVVARAQAPRYPSRTIEIIVSYAAGGSTDIVARTIALKFQEWLGQPVVVINRPGASGTIGATSVARAIPDGYTLYAGFTTETVVVPQVSRNPRYSIDDFDPIAITGLVPVVLIGSKNVRANNLKELIEEVRGAPGKYTYGGSLASPSHIMGAWLNRLHGLNTTHIPYRGGAQAVADVSGGHIDMFYAGTAVSKPAIDRGLVKAFAVTGDMRSPALPEVPTFKEASAADFELASWTVLLAPKGTPLDVIRLLRREAAAALSDPQVRQMLTTQGVDPSPSQDVRSFLAQEREKFGKVVRELRITMD
jgi:tripartite-type tricarboxylate transporter receptor subunit TctC